MAKIDLERKKLRENFWHGMKKLDAKERSVLGLKKSHHEIDDKETE